MRWIAFLALTACACSLDWSVAESSDAGTGGSGAATGGATTGGASGAGGAATGGGGGAAGSTCSAQCEGKSCDSAVQCNDSAFSCCGVDQQCATPNTASICVPQGCFMTGELHCQKECPDLCDAAGMKCCASTGICFDPSDAAACP